MAMSKGKIMKICGECKRILKDTDYLCKNCNHTVADNDCLVADTADKCNFKSFVDKCEAVRIAVCDELLGKHEWRVDIGKSWNAGKGSGRCWWCRWVTVKESEKHGLHFTKETKEAMEIAYTLTFRFDDYSTENYPHLGNSSYCLFGTGSGNPHEIGRIGYIQFVEARNKFGDNPETASFKENRKWTFPDNKNPNTGRVIPLRFCDAPIPLRTDNKSAQQHIHVLDFFDNNGKGEINTDMVSNLADAFIGWIKDLQKDLH
jgi:hypothetical protein